ncbi:MAG: calcium/proton exchanger [Candidatus Dormibacteria bacterium]
MSRGAGFAAISTKTRVVLAVSALGVLISGGLVAGAARPVVIFVLSALTLAALAALVGDATEQLGSRMGAGATGILQSALGNLPELLISIFALRAGLVTVVQAALVGSILGNSLLVLGIAFLLGGLRHGTQRFDREIPNLIALMTLVAVSAVSLPTAARLLHAPAASHEQALSIAAALVLLVLFAGSLVYALRGGQPQGPGGEAEAARRWPLWFALVVLGGAGVASAFASDWFVTALKPATQAIGISQGFTGLVIVAIAGNAVENVVGVRFALQNRSDLALSVILNSSLQVALALIPALVLLSLVVASAPLTLVLSPLLVLALGLTAVITAVIVFDGESTWIEGLALIALYALIATSFWWG